MSKTDISIKELVFKVQRRELLLPEMQRRYVWPATRVRDLLDSLYRDYPTGTILTWETDQEVETRELAVRSSKLPITSNHLLLLDGQQRITSLAAILSGEKVQVRKKSKPIDIMFNMEHPEGPPIEVLEVEENGGSESGDVAEKGEEQEDEEDAERDLQEELSKRTFVVAASSLKGDPRWVPVSDIFCKTDKEILKGIKINSDDPRWDTYSERLQKVRKIADYMYSMQVLEKSKSYEEVTEIFVRVNSLGIKLRGSDLALAQISAKWKGFMSLIENFAGEFGEDLEDYIIETGLPVRTLVAFATKQSRFRTVGRLSKKNLEAGWQTAKEGLAFAINFVRANGGIQDLTQLSSPFLLVPIAVYASLKGENLSAKEEKALLRWFYLAHMRGHYSLGSSEGILDVDLSVLFRTKNVDLLIEQLEGHVKKFEVDEQDLVGRGIRSPMFSMLYFILKKNGAKDWFSGLKLSDTHVGKSHKIQYHHIFPKALLKTTYDRKEINEIANLAFIGGKTNRQILDKKPEAYLASICTKMGDEALSSQLVPTDSDLWKIDNYREFLSSRRKAIAAEINAFMRQLK
jgi:hypothetical protein